MTKETSIFSIKNTLKKIKQKINWYKYRNKYMQGIHSYHRRHNSANKKASILDKIIKAKKRFHKEYLEFLDLDQNFLTEINLNSYIRYDDLEIFLEDYVEILSFYKESFILEDSLSNLEIFLAHEVIKPMKITDRILNGFNEEVLDSSPVHYDVPGNNSGDSIEMKNVMYDDDKYKAGQPPVTNAVPMLNKKTEAILDQLQVWLETNLRKYGLSQINVDQKDDIIHIDTNFKGGYTLTFALYIDPKQIPRIDCIYKEGQGKDYTLPIYYSVDNKIYLSPDFERDFPLDFMVSCIKEYIPAEHAEITENQMPEFSILNSDQPLMEIKFRKVIDHGILRWKPVANVMKRKLLNFKQKFALALARKHAHSAQAERSRSRSRETGVAHHLYSANYHH